MGNEGGGRTKQQSGEKVGQAGVERRGSDRLISFECCRRKWVRKGSITDNLHTGVMDLVSKKETTKKEWHSYKHVHTNM